MEAINHQPPRPGHCTGQKGKKTMANKIMTVDELQEILYNALGADELLLNIIKALGTDTKAEIFEYIASQWDIETA